MYTIDPVNIVKTRTVGASGIQEHSCPPLFKASPLTEGRGGGGGEVR